MRVSAWFSLLIENLAFYSRIGCWKCNVKSILKLSGICHYVRLNNCFAWFANVYYAVLHNSLGGSPVYILKAHITTWVQYRFEKKIGPKHTSSIRGKKRNINGLRKGWKIAGVPRFVPKCNLLNLIFGHLISFDIVISQNNTSITNSTKARL